MERWLWFVLFAVVGYAAYDYGRRTEREIPLQAELAVYRDRDALRSALEKERNDRGKAIAAAVAQIAISRDRERAEAAASTLAGCPVDPQLDQLRRARDAEANATITAAYGGGRRTP